LRTIALLLVVVLGTRPFFFGIENQVRDEEESVIALQALRAEIATAESSVEGHAGRGAGIPGAVPPGCTRRRHGAR
jgi:hypothetical protein